MDVFKLYIKLSGDAFAYDEDRHEVARILRDIADKLVDGSLMPTFYQTIRDINGNDVGRYAVKPEGGLTI